VDALRRRVAGSPQRSSPAPVASEGADGLSVEDPDGNVLGFAAASA